MGPRGGGDYNELGGGVDFSGVVIPVLPLYVNVSWYVPCSHTGASAGYHRSVLFPDTHVRLLESFTT